jgi:hypothetical protein
MNRLPYKLYANQKNASYEEQNWTKSLSNGNNVHLLRTIFYRYLKFEVTMNDEEKNTFLEKDEIRFDDKLNIDYYVDFNDCTFSTIIYTIIKDYDKLNEEEIKEINNSLNINNFNEDNGNIDFSEIDKAGWDLEETFFGISSGGCIIYDIDSNSDEEDYY